MYVRYCRASLIILHRNKHYYSIIYDILLCIVAFYYVVKRHADSQ